MSEAAGVVVVVDKDLSHKFEKVLHGFSIRGNKAIRDDVYLNKILTNLTPGADGAPNENSVLLGAPFVVEFIKKIHSQTSTPEFNGQIYAFSLRLLALVIGNEQRFLWLKDSDMLTSLNQNILSTPQLQTASIKLAHVKVLQAMRLHSVGTHWLIHTQSWRHVIGYCMENQTVYVVRESQTFITHFLFRIASEIQDEDLCKEIVATIIAPLEQLVVIEADNIVNVDNDDLQRKALPCIEIMSHLLEHCVRTPVKSCLPRLLKQNHKSDKHFPIMLWRLTDRTKNPQFFTSIMRTLGLFNMSTFTDQLMDTPPTVQSQVGLSFFNELKFCMVHRNPLALLAVAQQYHSLWTSLGDRAPLEIELESNKIKFENQMIVVQMTPLLHGIRKAEPSHTDECFDSYFMTLFDISTEHTLRACYLFREELRKNPKTVSDIATKAIQGMLAIKGQLHHDRAVYVFQALCWSLKEFAGDENTDKLMEMPNLLSAILTGLHTLVKQYRITWKDSIESVCLLNFMLSLLNKPNLSARLAVQSLQLAQLSIEHFLAPNLALLVDTMQGSAIETLGPTVMRRLHDTNWEVRDSTLELLAAVSNISIFKFPAFQHHLLEHQLIPVVVNLAKNDSEAFVRASALTCLCPMVCVKILWEQCLSSMDLMAHLLHVLRTESEGIVRKAAVDLVCEIYQKHRIPNNDYEQLFRTLAHTAVADLYWEVKHEALIFWKLVIMRQFLHNGVIDGQFPAVTFSKELKKIVTLTPKEISIRLNRIMDELSTRGALGVVLECLNDECDLEVVKRAAKIVQGLNKFLQKYKYLDELQQRQAEQDKMLAPAGAAAADECVPAKRPMMSNEQLVAMDGETGEETVVQPMEGICCGAESSSAVADVVGAAADTLPADFDQIIESIVSADDINLLVHAYENQLHLDAEEMAVTADDGVMENGDATTTTTPTPLNDEFFKTFAQVKPLDYLRRVGTLDLDRMIEARCDWMQKNDSFSSLLEDIMFSLEIADVNEADCY